MCGIIGSSVLHANDRFSTAMGFIESRGPDYKHFIAYEGTMLGHTRLAILDLDSRSNQPFMYEYNGTRLGIVFNGEIYNFLDLKKQLTDLGYVFNTTSDTEVVCAAYLEWGTACFDYFLGMWAVGIVHRNKVILARDRNGKKPLYYAHESTGELYFSSSLRSVQSMRDVNEMDLHALELYFALGFIPDSYSIYKGTSKVLPGEVIEFERVHESGYTLLKKGRSELKHGVKSDVKSIRQHIKRSVDDRLISDVPIGTLMSGGVDSTIISYFVQKASSDAVSYFVDFDDHELSEKDMAVYLAKRNKLNQEVLLVDSENILKEFDNYYQVYEEPFADYSGIASIAVFREASKHHKVILTGDGGDELFYGYPHYFIKWILLKSYPLLRILPSLATKLIPSWQLIFSQGIKGFESGYLSRHGVLTQFARSFIDNAFNATVDNQKSLIRGLIEYDRVFYNWPEKYLVKVDRSSMAFGVEVRSPFMDEHLKNAVAKIPSFLLFTPFALKLFLKVVFYDLFGMRYLLAKKKGFTPPIQVLRDKHYLRSDFDLTKRVLQDTNPLLYKAMENIQYDDLIKDKILFDRFFFFHSWLKVEKLTI